MTDDQTPDAAASEDADQAEPDQPVLQFAAVRLDPLTQKPIISTELDWNYGSAALVAGTLGGEVFARAVGPWVRVVPAVEGATQEPAGGPVGDGEADRG